MAVTPSDTSIWHILANDGLAFEIKGSGPRDPVLENFSVELSAFESFESLSCWTPNLPGCLVAQFLSGIKLPLTYG